MKIVSVVCRVVDDDGGNEHLHNIEPATFLDLIASAVEGKDEADDIAELEAELAQTRAHGQPVEIVVPSVKDGEIILPREVVIPLVNAKTRGELIEKLDELLSQFNARIAKEGEL